MRVTRTVVLLVVQLQQIHAKVAIKSAPHSMDVVRVVLGVIVLNEKRGALYRIVMRVATIQTACPGKMNLVDAGLFQTPQLFSRDVFGQVMSVFAKKIRQLLYLRLGHLFRSDTSVV